MFFRQRFEIIHYPPDKRDDVDPLYLHLHFLILNLTEIKDLIDQMKHPVRITFYYDQLFTCIFRQFRIFQDMLYRAGYQSQRCTKLM